MSYAAPSPGSATIGPDPAAMADAALAISRQLATLAEGMRTAAAAFPAGTFSWRGPAADLMADLLATRPERFAAVAVAGANASTALAAHADRLGPAAWLHRQARQAPAELAAELEHRAAALVDESAQVTAAALVQLARSAPPRAGRVGRWMRRLGSWRSEVVLGASESTEQLTDAAVRMAGRFSIPISAGDPAALVAGWAALANARQHPGEVVKAALDWDTWQHNPARAVGHLLPDLVTAEGGAGVATGSRVVEIGRRTQLAVRAAATRDTARRQAATGLADGSRQALVAQALAAAERPGAAAAAWSGEGGTRLSARQNAGAEAFHALSSAREPAITRTMSEISKAAESELAGLKHRVKAVDSLKRKLATQQARTGEPLPALLAKANDLVRYTVVIDEADYVRGVPQVAAQLEAQGFHHLAPPNNAWHSGRYRGINTSWQDPVAGAAFEVQFHTPASWQITKATHPIYEESRLPDISPQHKALLHAQIAEAFEAAPVPPGVEALTGTDLTPPSPPSPIVLPTDYTVHATLATGMAAIVADDDLSSAGIPGDRIPARNP